MAEALFYRPSGNAIYETIDNETIIINLDNGRYYSLNPAGSFIWDALTRSCTTQEIADAFARRDQINTQSLMPPISEFVAELSDEGLIAPATEATRAAMSDLVAPVNFKVPHIMKFTDMEKLIPLDPIHQVGTQGWPFADPQQ